LIQDVPELPCEDAIAVVHERLVDVIKIGVVHGGAFVLSQDRLEQVQEIFQNTFPTEAAYAARIPSLLRDPLRFGYRSALLVAENAMARVEGFALLMHFPAVECAFLDFLGVRPDIRGGGIGGALYEAAREYAQRIGAKALYLEVVPDLPELTPDPIKLEESRKRIRFYETYGVRVIEGTAYSTPVGKPPTTALLLYDGLGNPDPPSRHDAQRAVEMILTRRFGHVADPDYVRHVVDSFKDDPVTFRPRRHIHKKNHTGAILSQRLARPFTLVASPVHEVHHIQERGYFERPVRVSAIQEALDDTGLFSPVPTRKHGKNPILAVHDADFVHYLQTVCSKLKAGRPMYPDTFPVRRPERRPKELLVQAGYYCIDTGTPFYRQAYIAARAAADTALTAAGEILAGKTLAYAVCRPPGHHAGRRFHGGFCYFNNAAIAAQHLSKQAKVLVLDLDFHHGNGTQDIFYERSDVMTISIHGHPDFSYPYFSGYEYETGADDGLGFNRNFPLPPQSEEPAYRRAFERSIEIADQFKPDVLIVGLGYDIVRGDPTGSFLLPPGIFRMMGRRIMELNVPVLVVQEGGYNIRNIKRSCAMFFNGCAEETVDARHVVVPQQRKTGEVQNSTKRKA
jgi:acetoin utilization deacetylase AcuC-like enzyme/GNAT superfamily N-acetyltransferase